MADIPSHKTAERSRAEHATVEWNRRHPIGEPVMFQPEPGKRRRRSVTTSAAYVTTGRQGTAAVVFLQDATEAVPLALVEPVESGGLPLQNGEVEELLATRKCPRCCSRRAVESFVDGSMLCRNCRAAFDDDPDEGGDWDDRNPARRLEREEQREVQASGR